MAEALEEDDPRILSESGLMAVNQWLRQADTDRELRTRGASTLRSANSLSRAVRELAHADDVFLGALDRLPDWMDRALRSIAIDALENGQRLRVFEVLEPLPDRVDHWSLEHWHHGNENVVSIGLPARLACRPD